MPRITLYHGSDREFDHPKPLTHFGTRAAAEAAPRSRGTLMAFEITLDNPLRVTDTPGGGDTWYWLRCAVDAGVVSEVEFVAWERNPTNEAFIHLVASKGFDGLVYRNDYEDPGSESFVIFQPDQAVRVSLPADTPTL